MGCAIQISLIEDIGISCLSEHPLTMESSAMANEDGCAFSPLGIDFCVESAMRNNEESQAEILVTCMKLMAQNSDSLATMRTRFGMLEAITHRQLEISHSNGSLAC